MRGVFQVLPDYDPPNLNTEPDAIDLLEEAQRLYVNEANSQEWETWWNATEHFLRMEGMRRDEERT